MKREADFGILFRHWIKANPQHSCAYELKQTSGTRLPFSCLKDHQAVYLRSIKSAKGTLIRVQGVNGEPDYIYLRSMPACVVVKYLHSFHIIDIDIFLLAPIDYGKSLTESCAFKIAKVSVTLKK